MNMITKLLASNAKSLFSSELKGVAKKLINKVRERSLEDIDQEIVKTLGYSSRHYRITKDQKIIFSPSSVFFNEWVTNSPVMKGKLIKDEETSVIYYNDKPLNNTGKVDIINQFSRTTSLKNASIASHLEGALKLLEISDFTSSSFREAFAGWNPEDPSIIDNWLSDIFGDNVVSDSEFSKKLFRKWIIGTATRAMNPGAPLDGCLVLKGPAGTGKTSFFRNLLPEPFEARAGEITCNVRNAQKFLENILGTTISCFDEFSVLEFARSQETFKQLLSSQFMNVRLPYRRDPQRYLLRQGFSATTNKEKFIPDHFFSRRLWIIELGDKQRVNFDYLLSNKKKLWQEAVYLAEQKERYLLTVEEQKQLETQNEKYLK